MSYIELNSLILYISNMVIAGLIIPKIKVFQNTTFRISICLLMFSFNTHVLVYSYSMLNSIMIAFVLSITSNIIGLYRGNITCGNKDHYYERTKAI